jgi:hypothetical protein
MSSNTYGIKTYQTNVNIGSTVVYTAGQNDVTTYGLEVDKRYAGMIVGINGYINDPDHGNIYEQYKIRLFLDSGNDLTIVKSELHYHTSQYTHGYTDMLPKEDGTFMVVNEEILFGPNV